MPIDYEARYKREVVKKLIRMGDNFRQGYFDIYKFYKYLREHNIDFEEIGGKKK